MKKGKYLITGRQGSGKTTVGKELKKLGYTVFDIDHTDGLGKLRELKTNKLFNFSDIIALNPYGIIDWNEYWYEVQVDRLKEILDKDDLVFITGITSNLKNHYRLFDEIFALMVDPKTVRERLVNHEHASHHLPSEVDRILENFEEKQRIMITSDQNVTQVDARQSLEHIIHAIKAQIMLK